MPPRVSVGLPVYNGGQYVQFAITAILRQTFSDFEFLISDNCSTDSTQQTCEDFARSDPRIRYIRQPRNLGAAPNHNLLVQLARGHYFMWVMHDDVYAPTVIERCAAELDRYPDAAVAYGKMTTIDHDGRAIGPVEIGAHFIDETPHRRFGRCLRVSNSVHAARGVIRVASLRQTMLNLPFRYSDHPLIAELALLGKIREVSEHLYFKRIHSASSLRVNTDDHMLNLWFDTSSASSGRWYVLSMYEAFTRGILRHPELGRREQALCLLMLQRWPGLQLRNWAGMHKHNLLQWLRHPARDGGSFNARGPRA